MNYMEKEETKKKLTHKEKKLKKQQLKSLFNS